MKKIKFIITLFGILSTLILANPRNIKEVKALDSMEEFLNDLETVELTEAIESRKPLIIEETVESIPVKKADNNGSMFKFLNKDKKNKNKANDYSITDHQLLAHNKIRQQIENSSIRYIDISKREKKGKKFYAIGEDTPYTGGVTLKQGDVFEYISHYKDGIQEGKTNWYSNDGVVVLVENYSKGSLDGEQLAYYENGKLKSVILYKNKKIAGVKAYSKSGELLHNSQFTNGNGYWKLFWENGNISEVGKYTNGRKDGVWKSYLESGEVDTIIEYNNGKIIKQTWQ